MFILTGIMTPKWLMGQPIVINDNNITGFYVPSVGIYNRYLNYIKVMKYLARCRMQMITLIIYRIHTSRYENDSTP